MTNLTPKQERFCQRFVESLIASEAYRQAYDADEMSAEAIHVEASRLMDDPKITLRIEALQKLARKRHEVTVDRVVAEFGKLAFVDIRRAFDEDGNLIRLKDLDDDTAAAIAGVEFLEEFEGRGADRVHIGRTHKIKLSDKKAALDSLAKFLGMFTDKVELTGKNGAALESTVIYLPANSRDSKPE